MACDRRLATRGSAGMDAHKLYTPAGRQPQVATWVRAPAPSPIVIRLLGGRANPPSSIPRANPAPWAVIDENSARWLREARSPSPAVVSLGAPSVRPCARPSNPERGCSSRKSVGYISPQRQFGAASIGRAEANPHQNAVFGRPAGAQLASLSRPCLLLRCYCNCVAGDRWTAPCVAVYIPPTPYRQTPAQG